MKLPQLCSLSLATFRLQPRSKLARALATMSALAIAGAITSTSQAAEMATLEVIQLKDGREVLGAVTPGDADSLQIDMVFQGIELGTLTVTADQVVQRRQPDHKVIAELNGMQPVQPDQDGTSDSSARPKGPTQGFQQVSKTMLLGLEQRLAAMAEDDPQRQTAQRARLQAAIAFNTQVVQQNVSNLLAMSATPLTNEDAMDRAADSNELQGLRLQVKEHNTVQTQVSNIKTSEPDQLRRLRMMRLSVRLRGTNNVFLAPYLQALHGSEVDQELAIEDALDSEATQALASLTSQKNTTDRRLERQEERIEALELRRKATNRKEKPKSYKDLTESIDKERKELAKMKTTATQLQRWIKEAEHVRKGDGGTNARR